MSQFVPFLLFGGDVSYTWVGWSHVTPPFAERNNNGKPSLVCLPVIYSEDVAMGS